jgi:hypothetical protein
MQSNQHAARRGVRKSNTLVPHDLVLERDVLLGLICDGRIRAAFEVLGVGDFYDPRHGRVLSALRSLHDHGELRRVVELRVGGLPAELSTAVGCASVWVGFTVPGMAEALREQGACDVRATMRYVESLFISNVPCSLSAVDRLQELTRDRARLFALDAERLAITDRWSR